LRCDSRSIVFDFATTLANQRLGRGRGKFLDCGARA
jgi:hypothetical protein